MAQRMSCVTCQVSSVSVSVSVNVSGVVTTGMTGTGFAEITKDGADEVEVEAAEEDAAAVDAEVVVVEDEDEHDEITSCFRCTQKAHQAHQAHTPRQHASPISPKAHINLSMNGGVAWRGVAWRGVAPLDDMT